MATPHGSGALALMAFVQPSARMAQLKQALFESVVQTASLAGKTLTGGRLDGNAAITRLTQLVALDPNAPTCAVAGPASVDEGSALSLNLSTTNVAAGTAVVLNDTSKPAGVTLWGTTANDAITGLAEADVFLLGDSRGVFYDDRVNTTIGSGDYALIKDFVSGIDKLQVRSGLSSLYSVSASGLIGG